MDPWLSVSIRLVALLSSAWAAVALTVQVLWTRGSGRRDYSRPAGSPWRAVWYSFTTGMMPARKESARLHAAEFALGLVLHVGVLTCLLGLGLLVASPTTGIRVLAVLRIPAAVALLAGICLLLRRAISPVLRRLSTPDDYLAILATCGLLACCAFLPVDSRGQLVRLVYFTALLVYLPLGKLRHAVFFFVSRGNYARRLGYRGVYPPARAATE